MTPYRIFSRVENKVLWVVALWAWGAECEAPMTQEAPNKGFQGVAADKARGAA